MPTVPLPAELGRVLTDYEAAWQQKNARALAGLFAEDGFVLSSGAPAVRGRAAIEKHYTARGRTAIPQGAGVTPQMARWVHHPAASPGKKGGDDIGKFTYDAGQKSREGRWLIMSTLDNANAGPSTTRLERSNKEMKA